MFQITLKMVREACGYTIEEVAKNCEISFSTLKKFEIDSEWMPVKLISIILRHYRVSSSLIYFGTEANCIRRNHRTLAKTG